MAECAYLPGALPKFYIVTVHELLCLFGGLRIIFAFERDCFTEVPVRADDIGAIFWHVQLPCVGRKRYRALLMRREPNSPGWFLLAQLVLLPLEQIGQIHFEYILCSLKTFQQINCGLHAVVGNNHALALNDLSAAVNVSLCLSYHFVQCHSMRPGLTPVRN